MDSPTLETRLRELLLTISADNEAVPLLVECLGEIQKAGKAVCPVWQDEARPDFDPHRRRWFHLHWSDREQFSNATLEQRVEKVRETADLINRHIMEHGDPYGYLAGAIDILDHGLGLPCPVCSS